MDQAPKLFISYSWSNPEHEQWVITLATRLRESGVDAILDKWDLKEGYDSISFMEQMVTDPTITKVAIISDKTYADKADGRAGGVGTETQIISREVYEKQNQSKFVAVLPTKDESGKAYLPAYYKGRIYIDLSEPERYAENFDKLLRWIYDKPLHIKPELGEAPSFLNTSEAISLGTTALHNRLLDALRNGKQYAMGALDEYLNQFSTNMARFCLSQEEITADYESAIVGSIEKFTPARNEFIQVVIAISHYMLTKEAATKLHRFFERIQPYMRRAEGLTQWSRLQFDNFKFVIHELFLYTVAVLVKNERFDLAAELLSTPYYDAERSENGGRSTENYTVLREYMHSFEPISKQKQRLSFRADLLKERSGTSGVEFRSLMQADFILFMCAALHHDYWWPETLVYASNMYGPFEVFARAQSKSYFDKAKILLGIEKPDEIRQVLDSFKTDNRTLPQWGFSCINPAEMLGLDKLATVP